MKKIRRALSILLALILIAMACGCESEPAQEENIPTAEEMAASYYNSLTTEFTEYTALNPILKYISSWAGEMEIHCTIKDSILYIGCDSHKSMILEGTIEERDHLHSMEILSEIMYILENHEEVGAVITDSRHIADLDSSMLSADSLISMSYGEETAFITESAAHNTYKISKKISWKSPRFDKAYRITIGNLHGGRIQDIEEGRPNPIHELNDLLTKWNTSGILFEIGEFEGGENTDSYPEEAQVTIVVTKADSAKIEKAIAKMAEKLDKKYKDNEPEYTFTYTSVPVPEKVLTRESSDAVTSQLYTMVSGTQLEDEQILGYANIGSLRIGRKKAVIRMELIALDEIFMGEMEDTISALTDISDFQTRKMKETDCWKIDDEGYFYQKTHKATDIDRDTYTASYLYPSGLDMDRIGLSFNLLDWTKITEFIEAMLE